MRLEISSVSQMEKGYTPVDWTFSTMPSEQWKNDLGSALTTYAADQTDANWKLVQTAFVDGWAKEAAAYPLPIKNNL